ncbi:MAG: glycosyltransferase family 4 protein [Chloroflexi bacterium]|nr:glycosyltransferase family 4 protein [Chloroflexota bacterium]
MRVAIVGAYPSDPTRLEGGVHAVISYLIEGLQREADVEVHVVTGVMPGQSTEPRQVGGVWVHPFPWARFKRLTFHQRDVLRIRKALRDIRPDLVHGHGPPAPYAAATFSSGFPNVVTWHGVMFREAAVVPGLRPRLIYALDILYERYCWSRMRHVIAISPYVMREYERFGRPTFHLVENPIADRYFRLNGEEQPDAILCAARLISRKDVLTLLRAFAVLHAQRPTARLRIAGETDSEPAYARQCREFVAREGLGQAVSFLGQLSEEQILDEYRCCSVVALSSRQETAPMVVEQAMAAGRAVVATPAGGVPWLVADGVTGLVTPFGDAERMAMALNRLLADAPLRHKLGARGREEAARRFHASAVARRTLEVYRQIMAESRPRP